MQCCISFDYQCTCIIIQGIIYLLCQERKFTIYHLTFQEKKTNILYGCCSFFLLSTQLKLELQVYSREIFYTLFSAKYGSDLQIVLYIYFALLFRTYLTKRLQKIILFIISVTFLLKLSNCSSFQLLTSGPTRGSKYRPEIFLNTFFVMFGSDWDFVFLNCLASLQKILEAYIQSQNRFFIHSLNRFFIQSSFVPNLVQEGKLFFLFLFLLCISKQFRDSM